jgi:hypothetical protein
MNRLRVIAGTTPHSVEDAPDTFLVGRAGQDQLTTERLE